jgi:hypothetical protein
MPSARFNKHSLIEVGSKDWIDDYCASLMKRIVNLELLNKHFPEGRKCTEPKIEAYYKEWTQWRNYRQQQYKKVKSIINH